MTPGSPPDQNLKSSFHQASPLNKGQEVNLNEIDPALHRVRVGLGWEAPEQNNGFPVDIDASAFILNRDGRVRRDTDFIFYNNLETESKALQHLGDSTSGEGDGDDEIIEVNLENLSFDVEKIAFAVTIHNAEERQQTFGLIKNAFMRMSNADTGVELARFDLTEDAAQDNGVIFGELVREGIKWKFKALGTGTSGGLYRVARDFGVNVAAN
jgi:tellurium resistance protein TerD